MNGQEFRKLVKSKRVLLDGATGSNLFAAGMPRGVCPIGSNPGASLTARSSDSLPRKCDKRAVHLLQMSLQPVFRQLEPISGIQEDGHTFHGNTPESAAVVLGGMGADAVGMNCSAGPDRLLALAERMAAVSDVPVIVKPNAGLPVLRDGKTVYDMEPEQFAECMDSVLRAGVSIVGVRGISVKGMPVLLKGQRNQHRQTAGFLCCQQSRAAFLQTHHSNRQQSLCCRHAARGMPGEVDTGQPGGADRAADGVSVRRDGHFVCADL